MTTEQKRYKEETGNNPKNIEYIDIDGAESPIIEIKHFSKEYVKWLEDENAAFREKAEEMRIRTNRMLFSLEKI